MNRGTVIANRSARRAIRLDDGRVVSFELAACDPDRPPHVDQVAWVDLDPSGERALRLTTIDPAAAALPRRTLSDGVAALHAAGIARELDSDLLREIREDLEVDDDDALLFSVLSEFYVLHPAAAARDGWISCDWREPLADLVAQINAAAGKQLLAVLAVEERKTAERGYQEVRSRVTFATAGGDVTCDVDCLNDVIALASRLLVQSGDDRPFVDLTEDDDVRAIRLSRAQAATLSGLLRAR